MCCTFSAGWEARSVGDGDGDEDENGLSILVLNSGGALRTSTAIFVDDGDGDVDKNGLSRSCYQGTVEGGMT